MSPSTPTFWYEWVDDPVLFYRLVPNRTGLESGRVRTQTQQRIRGPFVYTQQPPPGASRVLWVGDSTCFGSNVGDEETAPYQFGRLATGAGLSLESINLGVVGYNVRQIREVLARRITEFQGAKLVVYLHHENDIVNAPWADLAPHLPGDLYWEWEPPQPFARKLIKRSALARRLWNTDAVVRWLRSGPSAGTDPAESEDILEDRASVVPIHSFTAICVELYRNGNPWGERFFAELVRMAAIAREHGAMLLLVYWPSRTLLHHAELDALRAALRDGSDQTEIGFLDLTDDFLRSHDADLYSDTVHPGPSGFDLMARRVLDVWQATP